MSDPTLDIQELFGVKGLVVVITGGGSGLGAYAARALDANGAKAVYIVGRRADSLQDTVKSAKNGSVIPIVGDVSSRESLAKIAQQVRDEQGYINVLFANAGIMGPTVTELVTPKQDGSKPTVAEIQKALFDGVKMEDFTNTFHVNTTAPFFTTMAFLDLLDAGNKKGNVPQTSQVIVTTSIAGFNRGILAGFAYNASKAGANQLVKILATFFGQNQVHIRVNAIAPGLFPSEMTERMLANAEQTEHTAKFPGSYPLPRAPAGRSGNEGDFAATVLYLVSRGGAYLNGQITIPDGGSLAVQPSTY